MTLRLVWLLPLLAVSCVRGGFVEAAADGLLADSLSADGPAVLDASDAFVASDVIVAFDGIARSETGTQAGPPPLARWRVNEAATGQLPTLLLDDRPAPVNLSLIYDGANPVFATGLGGGRHLRFNEKSSAGGVADIAGTKLDGLHGSRTATLEAKARFDACTADTEQQRVFGLADGDEGKTNNWLTVRVWQERFGLAVSWAGTAGWVFYSGSCIAAQTVVVHWVIDTNRPVAADRVRGYIDGVRIPSLAIAGPDGQTRSFPELGAAIDLGSQLRRATLGRAHTGERRAQSRIYFAAIYSEALTTLQIAGRAAVLKASDD